MPSSPKINLIAAGIICAGLLGLLGLSVVQHFASQNESHWVELDDFSAYVADKAQNQPLSFDLAELASTLERIRVDGFAVCAPDEISAEQYVDLAMMVDYMSKRLPELERSVYAALSSDNSISDCQIRVLDMALTKADDA